MIKVSKNIALGEPISDIRELQILALEGKSIIQKVHYPNRNYIVRPASFYLSWPLRLVLQSTFYYSIKIENDEL